jgi:biofilm PGA synthesis N-glycosyltransferase PgaC
MIPNQPMIVPGTALQSNYRHDRKYVLMTAAYNEQAFIEQTIISVLSQTVRPERWVIVSDNSSDGTDEIIKRYGRKYDFIQFLRVTRPRGRDFRSKALALQKAAKLLQGITCEFVGNIDADISVDASYFEDLMNRFENDPRLGLASGFVYEERAGRFRNRKSNRIDSVPHAAQLVRRECYEQIGGYAVLKYGGEDWHAQTCARMNGWRAEAIPGLPVFHHRHTGAGTSFLRAQFRLGRLDYSLGSDPVFEMFKCVQRFSEKPLFAGGITRLAGFCWSYLWREMRPVSDDFIAFLRREQKSRVLALFSNLELGGHARSGALNGRAH